MSNLLPRIHANHALILIVYNVKMIFQHATIVIQNIGLIINASKFALMAIFKIFQIVQSAIRVALNVMEIHLPALNVL